MKVFTLKVVNSIFISALRVFYSEFEHIHPFHQLPDPSPFPIYPTLSPFLYLLTKSDLCRSHKPCKLSDMLCPEHSFLVFFHCIWLLHFHTLCSTDVPFKNENSTSSYSLHLGQLYVSVLITIYYKQKFI